MRFPTKAAPALLACAALVACGSSDEDKIKETVDTFAKSVEDKDSDTFCGNVTSDRLGDPKDADKAVERCKKEVDDQQFESIGKVTDVKVTDIKVDGRTATAQVSGTVNGKKEKPSKETFRKIDDDWKIDLDE